MALQVVYMGPVLCLCVGGCIHPRVEEQTERGIVRFERDILNDGGCCTTAKSLLPSVVESRVVC
jgi:hypothetical protein